MTRPASVGDETAGERGRTRAGAALAIAWALCAAVAAAHHAREASAALALLMPLAALLALAAVRRLAAPGPPALARPALALAFALAALGSANATLGSAIPAALAQVIAGVGVGFWSIIAITTCLSGHVSDRMYTWLGLLGAIVGAALTVAALALAGPPDIDTYTLIQGSSAAILAGADPYALAYAPTAEAASAFAGNVEVLTYPPGVPLLLAPARALVGDARWGLVAAMLAIVAVIALLARRRPGDPLAAAAPAMAALAPGAAIVGERAWVDPLLALALILTVTASAAGRPRLAILAAALALLVKQNALLALLLLAWWRPFGWRRALVAIAVAGLVALPFLLGDPARFVDRLTLVFGLPLRSDAINVAGWLAHEGLATPARLAGLALLGGALVIACAALLARARAAASPALALAALAAGQLAVNVFSGHAFYNQHWEVVVLLAAAGATWGPRTPVTRC